jgi:hypothetical protein
MWLPRGIHQSGRQGIPIKILLATAVTDSKDLVKGCKGCQFFAKQQHLPAQVLRTIPPSLTSAIWGLDAVGPFRTVPCDYKHILVAVDKFTKWIEVRPVTKVTLEEVVKFIKDITHRFGVPNRIITDLGKAFTGSIFWDFCQENTIDIYYSSVAHPRCNSQVERANGMVLQALKYRIYDDASNYATWWLDELLHVIWGLRTQVSSARAFHPSFWSTDRKPFYLPTSPLELHASSSTRKERPNKHAASTSIASKNRDLLLS